MKRTGLLLSVIQAAVVFAPALPIGAGIVDAQSRYAQHATAPANGDQELRAQLMELRVKVARLEAALGENHQRKATPPADTKAAGMQMSAGNPQPGMGMMEGESMGMQSPGSSMSSMAPGAGPGASPCMGMMGGGTMGMRRSRGGMDMMGSMGSSAGMPVPSALPGFPGASHLYHVGATGFFLDHPEHITLTVEQQTTLGRIKEKTLLEQATTQRKIEGAEQELWTLTSADQPAADKVEAKIREIEKLRADQRLAFIRAVGEAAQVLTDEQRKALLGQLPPATPSTPHAATPGMPSGAPNAGAGMNDM